MGLVDTSSSKHYERLGCETGREEGVLYHGSLWSFSKHRFFLQHTPHAQTGVRFAVAWVEQREGEAGVVGWMNETFHPRLRFHVTNAHACPSVKAHPVDQAWSYALPSCGRRGPQRPRDVPLWATQTRWSERGRHAGCGRSGGGRRGERRRREDSDRSC